jgi:hypothetical protein
MDMSESPCLQPAGVLRVSMTVAAMENIGGAHHQLDFVIPGM